MYFPLVWISTQSIITLDQHNISDYVTLPGFINDKHRKGIIDNTKYANLLRLQLLIEHGGTWIDSTVFCTGRETEYLMHLPLFVFRLFEFADVPSNWFMVSDAHDPILTLVRDLHFEYWKKYDYMLHYYIFHMFFLMAAEKYYEEWSRVPFISDYVNHNLQRIMREDYSEERVKICAKACDFHKLTWKTEKEPPSPRSIYQHIANSR